MSNVGYTRALTLTYLAEKVSITATTSDGKGNPGASTVTIIDEDTFQVRYQGAVGTGVQLFVPYGSRYRVSCGGIAYYVTPSDQIFTAETPSRAIPIVYAPVTRLVFDRRRPIEHHRCGRRCDCRYSREDAPVSVQKNCRW